MVNQKDIYTYWNKLYVRKVSTFSWGYVIQLIIFENISMTKGGGIGAY